MLRKAFRAIRLTALFIDSYVEQFERQILDDDKLTDPPEPEAKEPEDFGPASQPVFIPPEALEMVRPKAPKPKREDAAQEPPVEMKR